MQDPEYFVYFSRTSTRPKKHFGKDREAAMRWARENADKDTEVVECRTVWDARDQGQGE